MDIHGCHVVRPYRNCWTSTDVKLCVHSEICERLHLIVFRPYKNWRTSRVTCSTYIEKLVDIHECNVVRPYSYCCLSTVACYTSIQKLTDDNGYHVVRPCKTGDVQCHMLYVHRKTSGRSWMSSCTCHRIYVYKHLYCLEVQAGFYRDAVECWMFVRRVAGSILGQVRAEEFLFTCYIWRPTWDLGLDGKIKCQIYIHLSNCVVYLSRILLCLLTVKFMQLRAGLVMVSKHGVQLIDQRRLKNMEKCINHWTHVIS